MKSACPCCQANHLSVFYEVQQVPVHSCLMLSSQEEAEQFPCADIKLAICTRCGFITNLAFDAKWSAYAANYEDQQSFSPTFNRFAKKLASTLVQKYHLYEKEILEIGCSKGDFLLLLCELGNNTGVGIDPSVLPGRVKAPPSSQVKFIADYFSEKHAQYIGNFICCRHTLEHIQPVSEFVEIIRRAICDRKDIPVVFEIPDTVRVLKDLTFEDIYYEHCSYFTPGSLARLFKQNGFDVTDLYRDYGDQYLLIEAQATDRQSRNLHHLEETVEQTLAYVAHFQQRIQEKLDFWRSYLAQAHTKGEKVVIWGSGSKCVAFLTTLNKIEFVDHVIDINPHRQGKFIPGVGKQVMPPEFLQTYQPDKIIIMNSIYEQEITKMLESLNVQANIISL